MFILDRPSSFVPRGRSAENIRSIRSFPAETVRGLVAHYRQARIEVPAAEIAKLAGTELVEV